MTNYSKFAAELAAGQQNLVQTKGERSVPKTENIPDRQVVPKEEVVIARPFGLNPKEAEAKRDAARREMRAAANDTTLKFGDPPPGRSALAQRLLELEKLVYKG